ncbi:conserved hypothetical protein; putative inner membrane protein [Vibrio nigripulchritudo SOn1]|uniref:Inner membrane protein yhaI n=1 Tax=Vibrio nigripulchritudo SOn1 TaxID=1238450 RepID=A0AAV2VLC3_9VIBR|nr:DUF805 domain-containing protein [Vibrio nigripulchritudo]CCO45160.1 conserved hypothetical protein; putative inner membrane protein [Vibrio nigripulchritudo SOn1]
MEWYLIVLKKYAVFEGRARRKEYWMFVLFNVLVSVALGVIEGALGTSFIGIVYGLVVFIPGVAVTIRRLHDIGRTGWWILISFIPFLGWLVLVVFAAIAGDDGSNDYGDSPKEFVGVPNSR